MAKQIIPNSGNITSDIVDNVNANFTDLYENKADLSGGKVLSEQLPSALAVGTIEQVASQSTDKAPSSVNLINLQKDKILYPKGATPHTSAQSYYVNSSGVVTSIAQSTWFVDTVIIPVNAKLLKLKGYVAATYGNYAFYNAATLLSVAAIYAVDVILEVPSNATVLYITRYYNQSQAVTYFINKDVVIEENKANLAYTNELYPSCFIKSFSIRPTGNLEVLLSTNRVAVYIIDNVLDTLIISTLIKFTGTNLHLSYAFYSALDLNSTTFISGGSPVSNETVVDQEIEIPDNAKYFVLAYESDSATLPSIKIKNYKLNGIILNKINRLSKLANIIIATDSLGAMGSGFSNYLLFEKYYTPYYYGVGGETSTDIGGRLGAIPFIISSDIIIPATTNPVALTLKSSWNNSAVINLGDLLYGVNPCYIRGIKGTLARVSAGNFTFTRTTAGAETSVKAGELVKPACFDLLNKSVVICWMGQNGGFSSDFTILLEQFKTVARQVGKYLFISSHQNTNDAFELSMRKEFGLNYINMRYWCVNYGLAECGITPTEADTAAIALGNCPPSLLSDATHFITAAKQAQAAFLLRRLRELDIIIG